MFEMEGFLAQKGLWNLARSNILQDRGAVPQEDGHIFRESKVMHEEDFMSSWFREESCLKKNT